MEVKQRGYGMVKRKVQSMSEYAVLLAIALSVFVGMEVYLRRAIQAKVKDLTDVLIAPKSEHVDRVNKIIPLTLVFDEETERIVAEETNRLSTSESCLKETIAESSESITRVKSKIDGTRTTYRVESPDKEIDDPQGASKARARHVGEEWAPPKVKEPETMFNPPDSGF